MMPLHLTLDGSRIHDIPSFYDEVDRVFMAKSGWKLGHRLDALNDLLHGSYGALDGVSPVKLAWTDFAKNRDDLGIEATRAFLQAKLDAPGRYDRTRIRRELDALDDGSGRTFFEIVLDIIASHPNITLVPG